MENNSKKDICMYKKWWFWAIIVVILICILYFFSIYQNNNDDDYILDEGISLSEFNAIEIGKTDILALKGLIGYTDKNFDKIVSEVEKPIYEEDEEGITHIYYKQKYIGENGEGYAVITIERYLDEFIVIEKENYGLK